MTFFLILSIFIAALTAWRTIRWYQSTPDLGGFSAEEKDILLRQSLALVLLLPFFPLAVYAVVFRGSRWSIITYLAVSTVILTYVAMSSIINRVSALPTRYWGRVPKGQRAVIQGIFYIVILMIAWAVVLLTNFLQLVGFQ